jgi:hypothetical protein
MLPARESGYVALGATVEMAETDTADTASNSLGGIERRSTESCRGPGLALITGRNRQGS